MFVHSFYAYTKEERLLMIYPLLERRIKCSSCGRHYVDMETFGEDASPLPQLERIWLQEHETLVEDIRKIAISCWRGYEVPHELELDLVCVCGHDGTYWLKPNPFKCSDD